MQAYLYTCTEFWHCLQKLRSYLYFSATCFSPSVILTAEFSVKCALAKRQSKVSYPSKPHRYNYFLGVPLLLRWKGLGSMT